MADPKVKVLHVDDNEANRYIVARILRNAGFAVVEAETGTAGLEAVIEHQPDLVILDVKLPDQNGFEVCRQIKSNPETAFIPVLHLSASFIKSQDKAEGLDSGADAYLAQPVEPIELVATVRSLLRIRRAEEAALASAREWQITFDSINDGVGLLDENGRFLRCNQALIQLFGKPVSDILGAVHYELMHSVLEVGDGFCFRQAKQTHQRQVMEMQAQGRWFAKTIDPVLDYQTAFTGAVFILADVTQRKRAENSLRFLSEASAVLANSLDFHTLLTHIAQLVVPILADFCFFEVLTSDGTTQRLVWHPLQETQLVGPSGQVDLSALPWPQEITLQVLNQGQSRFVPQVSEAWLQSAAPQADQLAFVQSLTLGSLMTVPLIVGDRKLGALTLCLRTDSNRHYTLSDLTLAEELARRTALALENARLYREAQEVNRIKDEFLAVLSHELRSPLNPILGWARMLQTGTPDATKTKYALETIERNAKLQAQLIEDLLDVSRILQGKLSLQTEPIRLSYTINAALETVRSAAAAKSIRLQAQLDPSLGLVLGDSSRLQQVFWNLLLNAVKFTPVGGAVEVQLAEVENQAEIRVRDTGKGIAPEFLPYVFDYFRQADSTTTRKFGGLGLGLAIVRHLTEAHGGTVQALSAGEGQGATFIVRLPLIPAAAAKPEPAAAAASTTSSLEGLQVLLVDDDSDTREFTAFLLEQHGAAVTKMASGHDALASLQQDCPDLLISDIGMPEMDGYMLMRHIREQAYPPVGGVPAIALTAYAGESDRQKALDAGFQHHMAKPIDPQALVDLIVSLVKGPVKGPQRA